MSPERVEFKVSVIVNEGLSMSLLKLNCAPVGAAFIDR